MSVARPGMPKLNMPKAASPKAAIAANLGSASRSTGVSYGIFAQRTLTGRGIHLNNRAFNSASISATRHALNDNRTALFNNIGMPHCCNHDQGNNTMNKFMAGMMAMNMMAQLTAQTMKTINEAKAAKAGDVDPSKKTTGTPETPQRTTAGDVNNNTAKYNDIKNGLSANSTSIKNLKNELNTFGDETNQLIKNQFTAGSKALQGLELAGLSVENIANISLTEISLNDDPTLQNITDAIGTIDKNIATLNTKANTDIQGNITTCEGKKGDINRRLAEVRRNPDQNANQIQELENQLGQIDAAISALKEAKRQVEQAKKDLEAKKDQMNELKDQKKDLLNQRYNLVKDDNKKLTELNRDKNRLKSEIDQLRGKAYSAKDKEKLNKKIKEFNGMISQMKDLYTSLSSLGLSSVANAEGKESIDLSGLSGYASIDSEKIDELPVAGSAEDDKKFEGTARGQFNEGDVIELNGVTYKKVADGWIDERGNKIANTDAVLNGIYTEQPTFTAPEIKFSSSGGGATSGLSGLSDGAFNMPEFAPEGTITIGNKKYIPLDQNTYLCDGQRVPKDLVIRLQMAQ